MKLLPKFNLLFVTVFGIGFAATAYVARRSLQTNAREQVLQQARLMMEAARSTRDYTSKQIRPLLEVRHRQEQIFFAQTVPAYAAGQMFAYMRGRYPEYTYKEATLNPTNLVDRPADWENDVVTLFRNDSARTELVGQRTTPTGGALYLARPIRADATCLTCHGVPQSAPAAMLKLYGPEHGFGWKPAETIGAQIVSVPMTVPVRIADDAFRNLMAWLAVIFVGTLALMNVALVTTVIRPVTRMSAAADEISKGNLEVPELPVRGHDEIATLADAFNRMRRSLVKAMTMLE